MGGQYMARFDICDKATFALVKANEHSAFFGNPTH